jgi:hypothetical protein
VGLSELAEFHGLIVFTEDGGLETLKALRTHGVMLPAIVVTSMAKEVVEAVLQGTNSLTCIDRKSMEALLPAAVNDVFTIGSEEFERALGALENTTQNLQDVLDESRLHGNPAGS